MITFLWPTCTVVHNGRTDGRHTNKKMFSFHFNDGLFFMANFVTANTRVAYDKKCYKRIFIRVPEALDSISINIFFVGGLDPIVYTYIYSTLISGKIQCVFSISIRISLSARGGAMSNFSVLMFTSFALIHFKCQTPLTRAAPAIETQGVS